MSKRIDLHEQSRENLREGINILADSVKVTLGAMGRNVVINRPNQSPHVTKDGYSVAKEIFLDDPVQNMGAQMVKGVSAKTVEDTGDGTTTATVIAQAIVNAGIDALRTDKVSRFLKFFGFKDSVAPNPIDIKRGIDKAVEAIVAHLEEHSQKVITNEQIQQVATISANNDVEIGELIANAMEKVTKEGTITVEESKSFETYVDVVEGLKFHRGFTSAGFITNQEKQTAVLENPLIFMTPNKIENVQDIVHILQAASESNRSLLVIGGEISGEATATLAINKVRGGFKVAAIKAPFLGEKRITTLNDLATLTGGLSVDENVGLTFDRFTPEMFGSADKITIDKESTIIIGGHGVPETVESLKQSVRTQIDEADNKYDVKELEERLALLSGGVGVVYVGANSEVEMQEKKDRIDDALGATKSAIEEGIIEGGGVALLNSAIALIGLEGDNEDQDVGINIVFNALQAPLRQILRNAGFEPQPIVEGILARPLGTGFNVKTSQYVDMISSGVIDPKKVTRVALENAASVASLVLMTDCTITNK